MEKRFCLKGIIDGQNYEKHLKACNNRPKPTKGVISNYFKQKLPTAVSCSDVEIAEIEENSTVYEMIAVETMDVVDVAEQSTSDVNNKR